ncbi:hypothetical protein SO802_007366 [Lithocarpus litseifolius]|uniref:CCHC-type domain-containing protein n=1 Tax=Lithocarpus litseifolius TaxID=425828 RepID=A0AAW2DNP9_9ROSI
MDDITRQCARLSLHTKERQTIPLTSVFETNNRVLVANLFTKRRVNVEALSRTLKSMWRFVQDFEVRDLASNTVLLLFTHEGDAQKVISQGPWSFDKYLIGLYQLSASESVDDAKVRISINIEQPLCRGRYVELGGSDPHWISFQYERLPIFCYWCGRLNHDERDCKLWTDSGESLQKNDQQYGPWLRASVIAVQQPQLVHTKASQPAAPPQPQRPTPSPSMRPSPLTETMPPPSPNPSYTAQTGDTRVHAENFGITPSHKETAETSKTVPTHKEILADPTLFATYIADLDHDLNYTPTSNIPIPLPQLAHAPLTDIHENSYVTTESTVPSTDCPEALTNTHSNSTNCDHDLHHTPTSSTLNTLPQLAHTPLPNIPKNSCCTTKSPVPSNNFTDARTPTHPDVPYPTHIPDSPKALETTTFPLYHNVTDKPEPVHGTWRRIEPPRDNMKVSISSKIGLGPKRKQLEVPSTDDSHNEKKQKLLEMEAKSLGKLFAENLGSAHEETTGHILWECPLARNVWALVRGRIQKTSSSEASFFLLTRQMMERLSGEEFELWAMIAWAIWTARNRIYFQHTQPHPREILKQANDLMGDYQKLVKDLVQRQKS